MLLKTPIPTDLPPGRKLFTCRVPGCTEQMVLADYNSGLICTHHWPSHSHPRDEQMDLTAQSAIRNPQSAIA